MIKKGLGRGLDALFSVYGEEQEEVVEKKQEQKNDNSESVKEIDIKLIDPNKNQPRKTFNSESLKEMAESIKQHGIIQPIVVNDEGGRYMIIAGERRFRGAIIAGLKTVPVVIKHYTEKQIKEVSLIENLQREDLNPIESAKAIRELMEVYGFTQEAVADRIGKSRPAIANTLRLLTLYPEVLEMVEKNRLSAGHARTLVTISHRDTQIALALKACDNKLSVRELEQLVKDYLNPKPARKKSVIQPSIELKAMVGDMQRIFSTKVSVVGNDRKGRIYIDYYNQDDLERIFNLMDRLKR